MNNKQQIQKLKDNAELAWASYGYYDLIGKKIKNEKKYGDKANEPITLHDILDSTYYGYETEDSSFFDTLKLKGEFGKIQLQNFFKKYDLLEHCPNTDSGFSATLFKDLGEFDKKANTRKAVDKDSQYILSIRGTK